MKNEKRNVSNQIEFMLEQEMNKNERTSIELMFASESSLKKIWMTKEEDEAWKDL